MTQEDKQLLLRDLCARLPYGVKGFNDGLGIVFLRGFADYIANDVAIEHDGNLIWMEVSNFKPYLRPMSSMTEEEMIEYKHLIAFSGNLTGSANFIDWLNSHYFDYRGLIPKGLAIEITEENNPYKINYDTRRKSKSL